jgi:hypothetical protein
VASIGSAGRILLTDRAPQRPSPADATGHPPPAEVKDEQYDDDDYDKKSGAADVGDHDIDHHMGNMG